MNGERGREGERERERQRETERDRERQREREREREREVVSSSCEVLFKFPNFHLRQALVFM